MEPSHYVGLDVSQELTSVCVIDEQGAVVWRGKCATDPDAITGTIHRHAPRLVRAGLETGLLSNFLTRALRTRGVPVGEFGLANWPAIKERRNAARPNTETPSRSAWRQPRTLLLSGGNLGLRTAPLCISRKASAIAASPRPRIRSASG